MKHIEHATDEERAEYADCEIAIGFAKRQLRNLAGTKRAIAERCRARARRHKEGKP